MPMRPRTHKPISAPPKPKKPDKRPSAHKRGYGRPWGMARKNFMRRNPYCKNCGEPVIDPSKFVVDHIEPVSGRHDPLFWDEWNWQVLCWSCHSRKTALYDGGFGRQKMQREEIAP